MTELWAKLKQRMLVQWALAYVAVGGDLPWKFAPGGSAGPTGGIAVASVTANKKSIAMLPFVIMSADTKNTYFSDASSSPE